MKSGNGIIKKFILIIISWINISYSQTEIPHLIDTQPNRRFPVGMFSVLDLKKKQPISEATLDSIWKGNEGGYEACNILHIYANWAYRDKPDVIINNLLEPILMYNQHNPEADLKVLIGTVYDMFISASPIREEHTIGKKWKNHYLNNSLIKKLHKFVIALYRWDEKQSRGDLNKRIVAGWYCFDEPSEQGMDLHEYYRLIDEIKSIEDSLGSYHYPIYGDLSPEKHTNRKGFNEDYKPTCNINPLDLKWKYLYEHRINWDGITLTCDDPEDYIFLDKRFPSEDGTYKGRWYFTMWEADVLMIDFYGAQIYRWKDFFWKARKDFQHFGSKRSWKKKNNDWKLHAVLPGQLGYGSGINKWENNSPTHKDYHKIIKIVKDLDPDGIWFWAWNCSGCTTKISEYWLDGIYNWAEAVENEIENRQCLYK